METAFPLTAFEREKDLATAVKVSEPFRIFLILEIIPEIRIQFREPFEAFFISGQLIAFEHGYRRLDMHPPEFLVPFEFLLRNSFGIKEIVYSAEFIVPAAFNDVKRDFHTFFYQCLVVATHSEIHHKPQSLKIMARIDFPSFKAIDRSSVH